MAHIDTRRIIRIAAFDCHEMKVTVFRIAEEWIYIYVALAWPAILYTIIRGRNLAVDLIWNVITYY